MLNQTLITQINNVLKNEPKIISAYCFGSVAGNFSTRESDLDLAFVVKNKENVTEKQIYHLLKDLSFPKNLDISLVDKKSSPLFLFEIVSRGQKIYVSDEFAVSNFEAFVLNNYYDNSHLRNIYYGYLKNKFPSSYVN